MSSSESEGQLEVDVGDIDDSICILCNSSTYVGETISCDTCQLWFHFGCVGVKAGDDVVVKEDVEFHCPKCVRGKEKQGRKRKRATTKRRKKTTKTAQPVLSPPIKLKINLGKLVAPKSAPAAKKDPVAPAPEVKRKKAASAAQSASSSRRESQDEEEKWLDAVEAGNVNVVDPELKSILDPKLMTARQRAMVERQKADEEGTWSPMMPDSPSALPPSALLDDTSHMSLDYGYKKKKKEEEDTEDALRMKAIKSQKRKEIEIEKREQDKQKTMDRLLKKKDSKTAKQIKTAKPNRADYLRFTYTLRVDGATLSVPPGFEFPLKHQGPIRPPSPVVCAVQGCDNPRKYDCSKTLKPLCSLECYRKNKLLWSRNEI